MDANPWAFGWTPLLTIGLLITVTIAGFGFRTFEKWRREKIEEKRIEIALEALALAYECRTVFSIIRSPMSFGEEWQDLPRLPGEGDAHWNDRGPFYATLKRVHHANEFFERLERLRPRFMAVFGENADLVFKFVREAKAFVVVSARALAYREVTGPDAVARRTKYEADVWEGMGDVMVDEVPDGDRIAKKIATYVKGTEHLCRPIIDRTYGQKKSWWSWPSWLSRAKAESMKVVAGTNPSVG
jgi:hypothetical protein